MLPVSFHGFIFLFTIFVGEFLSDLMKTHFLTSSLILAQSKLGGRHALSSTLTVRSNRRQPDDTGGNQNPSDSTSRAVRFIWRSAS